MVPLNLTHKTDYLAEAQGRLRAKFRPASTPGYASTLDITGYAGFATFEPTGLCFDSDGNLYVLDYTGAVLKFDPAGHFLLAFGEADLTNGPYGIFQSPLDGNLYVSQKSDIFIYSTEGLLITTRHVGSHISGIYIDAGGQIYLADNQTNLIRIFNPTFTSELVDIDGSTSGETFDEPQAIWVDTEGFLYVADSGNNRVVVFKLNGDYIRTLTDETWDFPQYVIVDALGKVYVSDDSSTVAIFNPDGTFNMALGGLGTAPGQMNLPMGLAIQNNQLYVADQNLGRIQIFNLASGGAPILYALVKALAAQAQALEDTLWDLYLLRFLATATGAGLDIIGTILNRPRQGYPDPYYRGLLYLRIMEINSQGTPEELIQIYGILFSGARVIYGESYPAFYTILALGGFPFVPLSQIDSIMSVADPAGVGHSLFWAPAPSNSLSLDAGPPGNGLGGVTGDGQNVGLGGQIAGALG